jgi:hypothetical protein
VACSCSQRNNGVDLEVVGRFNPHLQRRDTVPTPTIYGGVDIGVLGRFNRDMTAILADPIDPGNLEAEENPCPGVVPPTLAFCCNVCGSVEGKPGYGKPDVDLDTCTAICNCDVEVNCGGGGPPVAQNPPEDEGVFG